MRLQGIEMRGERHHAQAVKLLHGGRTAENVHGLAAHKVLQPALDLGRAALRIGAEPLGLSLFPHQGRAAVRAQMRENGRLGAGHTMGKLHPRDFGDDFSALLHIHPVTLVNVQGPYLVFIHQRSPLHHGTAQQHRLQVGHGGNGAGAAHLVIDAQDGRAGLFSLEFIRNGPAGALGGIAQLLLAVHLVNLEYNAVRGIGKLFAGAVPVRDKRLNFSNILTNFPMGRYRKPPALGRLQGGVVGGEVHLARGNVVEGADKAPSAHLAGVLQFEGTAGGVARIGEKRLFHGLPLGIEAVEGRVWHKHLSADFKLIWPAASLERMGNGGYLEGIDGNVVSLFPVSAGKGAEQFAVPVGKTDGRSVKFELAAVGEGPVQQLGSPFGEFLHLPDGIRVGQRQHGILVRILGKAALRPFLQVRSHAAGGGVRRGILRIPALPVFQLVHQLVVLVVAHGGSVFHIILPAVLPENGLQLLYPMFCFRVVHNACVHARGRT